MRLLQIVVALLIFAPIVALGQFGRPSAGPRTIGLAWSDIADARDMRALSPAMRPDSISRVAVDLMPTPSGIPGSWMAGASGYSAIDELNRIGASFSRYELPEVYSSEMICAQYSRAFLVDSARRASGGIRLRYGSQDFGGPYLPLNDLTLDLGVSFDLLPELAIGFTVTHIATLYNNQDTSTEARTEYFGVSFRAIPEVTLNAAIESTAGVAAAFHAGIEYQFDRHVALRVGIETGTHMLSGGLGIHYAETELDFAILHHPDLGDAFSFGLGYEL